MATLAAGDASPLELLTSKSQRNLNCLSDPNRSTRRRALKKFVAEFDAGSGKGPKKSKERKLQAAFFKKELQHRLLPLLSDDIEKCRELALTLLAHFARHVVKDNVAVVSKEGGEGVEEGEGGEGGGGSSSSKAGGEEKDASGAASSS